MIPKPETASSLNRWKFIIVIEEPRFIGYKSAHPKTLTHMNRLVINPNKPDTWEIQLNEGANRLGRGEAADFRIGDPSVSGSHCQILVNNGGVSIQDLGSTNGTFINGARIQEQKLENGQTIRLGNVEMIFYADAPAPAAAPAASRLRVSGIAHEPPPAPATAAEVPPPLAPAIDLSAAATHCKFHPKSLARWFCSKCKKSFCDLCVNAHHNKRTCRACAVECVPMEVEVTETAETGFMASLPGAFIYPLRGTGILVLIFSALLFSALAAMGGIFSILIKIGAIGYCSA